LLVRAPFLALSATIGHADIFLTWLSRVDNVMRQQQEKYRHRVHYVCFNERWSDLEKYMYIPEPARLLAENDFLTQKPHMFVGQYETDFKTACIKIHPGAAIAMGLGLLKEDEFPPGLSLSPQDSLYLFDAMTKYVNELPPIYQKRLSRLRPDLFFHGDMYITKRHATEYERKLKTEVRYWLIGLQNCEVADDKAYQELGMDYGMPAEEEDIREEWKKAQEESMTKAQAQGKKHRGQANAKQNKPPVVPRAAAAKQVKKKGKEETKEEEKKVAKAKRNC